jgi:protein involved in temperature-dependent protein secretion
MSLSQEFSARMVPRTLLDNANEDIARLRQQLSSVLAEGCRGDADKEIRNLQTQVAPAPMAM